LSKVSKHYRALAEPYLYKNIVLKQYDEHGLMRLFFTLLARKDLALHILSLTLVPSPRMQLSTEQENENLADLWKYTNAAQEVLTGLMFLAQESSTSLKSQLWWLRTILSGYKNDTEDHFLAVVLCMAFDIENIDLHRDLEVNRDCKTRRVISTPWKGNNHPFKKPKSLTYSGKSLTRDTIPLLPSMSSLEDRQHYTTKIDRGSLFVQPLPLPASPLLRTLVFSCVENIVLRLFSEAIQSGSFYNLENLVLDGCRKMFAITSSRKLDELLVTLGTHTPNLKSLRWTNNKTKTPMTITKRDELKGLRKLSRFHTELAVLVYNGGNDVKSLPDLYDIFPESLEDLTIDRFRLPRIHSLIRRLHKNIGHVEDLEKAVSTLLIHLASSLAPLKRLALYIACEADYSEDQKVAHELALEDVVFLRFAADEFANVGVALEVFRRPKKFEEAPKLLIKQGWTVPLPHAIGG
jgi:hypothetical protein